MITKKGVHKESNNHFTNQEIKYISLNIIKLLPILQKQIEGHNFDTEHNGHILRQNNPIINNSFLYKFYEDGDPEIETNDIDYKAIINIFFSNKQEDITIDIEKQLSLGRIMGFNVFQSIPDGAPIDESNGFVDNYDIPPIDSWVYYKPNFNSTHNEYPYSNVNEILFTWIPYEAIKIINKTMEVEALKSYFWLDEHYPNIQNRIEVEIKTFANNL